MPRISKSPKEIKVEIMQACVVLFNEKGLKFTMDDVAKHCHISKKTMYLIFNDKEELFLAMVEHVFDKVKESEQAVLEDTSLNTEQKLRKLLGVLPEGYSNLDFSQMYSLKEKYPTIYKQVEARLETGWEASIDLLEQAKKEGIVKKEVHIPIVKLMFEASLEQFFQKDVLVKNRISYKTALNEVVNTIVDGILVREA